MYFNFINLVLVDMLFLFVVYNFEINNLINHIVFILEIGLVDEKIRTFVYFKGYSYIISVFISVSKCWLILLSH